MVFHDFHSKFIGYHILQNFACTSLTISIVPTQNNVFIPKQPFTPPPHQFHPGGKSLDALKMKMKSR